MQAIVALAKKIGPTDVTVLVAGETGTGKEVVAELIHASSSRSTKQMVCVNCAGLPAELLESELFGSSKGSFTGGIDRIGILKHAHGNTVFLDELSEMPLHLQAKLLRFVQDKRIRRVGSVGEETVDVRIIASINRLPTECVKQKCLREDLYYRIGTVTIIVPPLRDRPKDILPLARAYLRFYSAQYSRQIPRFNRDVELAFMRYDWPGNARQLQNEMNRCALLCDDSISLEDLNITDTAQNSFDLQRWLTGSASELSAMNRAKAEAIVKALIQAQWSRRKASAGLGISRQTLLGQIRALGIKTPTTDAQLAERTLLRSASLDHSAAPVPLPTPAPGLERDAEQSAEAPASALIEPAPEDPLA